MAEVINVHYPYEIKDLDPEERAEVFKHFSKSTQGGFIRVGPKGYTFPQGISGILPQVYNMELQPDDIWVVTFPKAGTTWTQEMVWLLANNLDYAGAKIPLVARFPFLEVSMFLQTEETKSLLPMDGSQDKAALYAVTNSFEHVAGLPSPRFIKSHLPFSLLPPSLLDTTKVVYVARDPRDIAVSYYHHSLYFKFMGYTSDFKNYWDLFMKNLIDYTPFFDHLKEAWALRHHPNMLFLFYEDIKKDLPSVVKRVAKFLEKTYTEEQITRLCDHLSFDSFKNNKAVNMDISKDLNLAAKDKSFVREGKSGGWRKSFDDEMTAAAERWIAENLRDTDFRFPTD